MIWHWRVCTSPQISFLHILATTTPPTTTEAPRGARTCDGLLHSWSMPVMLVRKHMWLWVYDPETRLWHIFPIVRNFTSCLGLHWSWIALFVRLWVLFFLLPFFLRLVFHSCLIEYIDVYMRRANAFNPSRVPSPLPMLQRSGMCLILSPLISSWHKMLP